MRTGTSSRRERLTRLFRRNVLALKAADLARVRIDDDYLEGRTVSISGRRARNFGICSYLGLHTDRRIKDAAIDAIDRYGAVYPSSAAYTSLPLYSELEDRLGEIFGIDTLIPTTTTLGHFAFFQVAFRPGDHIIVDAEAHASVHLALQQVIAEGIPVVPIAHNDVTALEDAIRDASLSSDRVWYLADGVYSMRGDVAPWDDLARLLGEYPQLHCYIDDAHGMSWFGVHGQGMARELLGRHPRVNVAVSLAKSFGSGGAALVVPDEELRELILIASGTMTFSGPLHPAELGAAVAAADIHLSAELAERQSALDEHLDLVLKLSSDLGVPLASHARTPIWFVPIGEAHRAVAVGRGLLDAGFYANVSVFPAVPHGKAGIRFANSLYLGLGDVEDFMEALSGLAVVSDVLGDAVDLRA